MKNKYNELISGLTDKQLLFHLYMTQLILLVITFILGYILFDQFSFLQALKFNDFRIVSIGIPLGAMVVIVDILLMKWLPESFMMMVG